MMLVNNIVVPSALPQRLIAGRAARVWPPDVTGLLRGGAG